MTPRKSLFDKGCGFICQGGDKRDPALNADLENIARAYLRLADQAKRNDEADVIHELTPTKKNGDQL
jgi:hypothetical protein